MSTEADWTKNNVAFYDSTHNPKFLAGVWADCPILAAMQDPSIAHMIMEDFNNVDAATLAGYTVTQASTGTFALAAGAGGIALADSGSTTVTQGVTVQKLGACFVPAADNDIWYEGRYKVVDTFDKAELFMGLSISDTGLITTSANHSTDHIGWQCVTDDGVMLFTAEKAGAGATKASTTLVEDTWVNLGFHVHGVTSIDHYINGVKQATTQLTANITVGNLTPSWVCQSGGTNDPILHMDWYKVFQLR